MDAIKMQGGGGGGGAGGQTNNAVHWTDARRPVPRQWIRSAEVRGNVVRRMGTQQQQTTQCLVI